ncbi:MAG: ABC transporter ATP-binding protein [Candidatus Euphemobacter frigidus]|nr:ABC transporter ATP-binding protein [Candidatus Euphemobacter frigidus]MDP8275684.1 ABC transporter ATP-binding protein [Candidatus Euphemobacter frigidus]
MDSEVLLTIRNLDAYYGQAQALRNVSLHVNSGEIVTLIGANGAGKTTLLNSIAGVLNSISGKIFFEEEDIAGLPSEKVVARGLSLVPEGRQVFSPLTVLDNLFLGAYLRHGRKSKEKIEEDLQKIWGIFPVLKERMNGYAGTLSGGEQQMLAVSRALMARPRLLLLDEPSMGLAPLMVKEIFRHIAELPRQGTTVLLVEQNARAAFEVAGRGYVLETGRIVLQGSITELLDNKEIKRAYLGKGYREVWE